MTKIAIIIGSTRPDRNGDIIGWERKGAAVGQWVEKHAQSRGDADYELIDLVDVALPFFDEPFSPAMGRYTQPHTRAWAERIASFDGFVFVTPEYNHSTSGALKNAIDFLYAEWHNKAAGFVSYGAAGGVRAVEQLRSMMGELQIADVSAQVELNLYSDFVGRLHFDPREHQSEALSLMLDQVVAWSTALAPLRVA